MYSRWRTATVHADGVYVVAKARKISDAKHGRAYDFYYYFKGTRYEDNLTGFLEIKDSCFFLKISASRPKLWREVEYQPLSTCLLHQDSMQKAWKVIPFCK